MASESEAASHDENRRKVCLLCRRKCNGLRKLPLSISQKLQDLVNFHPKNPCLPTAIYVVHATISIMLL